MRSKRLLRFNRCPVFAGSQIYAHVFLLSTQCHADFACTDKVLTFTFNAFRQQLLHSDSMKVYSSELPVSEVALSVPARPITEPEVFHINFKQLIYRAMPHRCANTTSNVLVRSSRPPQIFGASDQSIFVLNRLRSIRAQKHRAVQIHDRTQLTYEEGGCHRE